VTSAPKQKQEPGDVCTEAKAGSRVTSAPKQKQEPGDVFTEAKAGTG